MTIRLGEESPVFEFATAKEIEGLESRKVEKKVYKNRRANKNPIHAEGLRPIQKTERAQYTQQQQLRGIKKLSDYVESD